MGLLSLQLRLHEALQLHLGRKDRAILLGKNLIVVLRQGIFNDKIALVSAKQNSHVVTILQTAFAKSHVQNKSGQNLALIAQIDRPDFDGDHSPEREHYPKPRQNIPLANLWIYLKISKGSITFPVNISQYGHGLAGLLALESRTAEAGLAEKRATRPRPEERL